MRPRHEKLDELIAGPDELCRSRCCPKMRCRKTGSCVPCLPPGEAEEESAEFLHTAITVAIVVLIGLAAAALLPR